jgi:hypothetical protein
MSNTSDAPKWANALVARFGPAPYGTEYAAWEGVFASDLGTNWSAAEIIETLRWMQGQGQDWKAPKSASDLVRAVRTMRKSKRVAEENPNGRMCSLCEATGGWVYIWRDFRPDWTAEQFWSGVISSVPCRCPAGAALIQKLDFFAKNMTEAQREKIRMDGIKGCNQTVALYAAEELLRPVGERRLSEFLPQTLRAEVVEGWNP